MKKLVIVSLLLISIKGFSQDTFFQKSNPKAKKEAIRITNDYDRQLAMDGEQQLLFQKKVEEFLIRRYKIEKELTGEEKLDNLLALQQEETAEMNDILTIAQLTVYKKVKPEIQPLEIVSKE